MPLFIGLRIDRQYIDTGIGKQAGADQRLNKSTYPGLVGIEAAKQRCDDLLASALQRLDDFGDDATSLRWLAQFIVERRN